MLTNPEAIIAIRGRRSRESIARRADITEEALRLIEKGKTLRPKDMTVSALAEALGVSVHAITVPEHEKEAS